MKWIEAIGAPGVGKTFLLRRLLDVSKKHGIDRKWVSEEEFPEKVISRMRIRDCNNLLQCFLLLYSRQRLFSYRKKGVKVVLVNKIYGTDDRKKTSSSWNKYLDLHVKKVRESSYPDSIRSFIIAGYSRLIDRFRFYQRLELENPIYVDEGLLQNNFGINEVEGEVNEKPVLVIYYKEDVATVFKRVKEKEQSTGKRCAWYKGYNDEELKIIIEKVIAFQEDKIKWLKKFSIPVLEIDTEIVDDDFRLKAFLGKIDQHLLPVEALRRY